MIMKKDEGGGGRGGGGVKSKERKEEGKRKYFLPAAFSFSIKSLSLRPNSHWGMPVS